MTARLTPEGFVIETCRTCGADVVWAGTKAGKSMPVDAEPVDDGNVELTAVTRFARIGAIATVLSGPPLIPVPLRKSHFATCPDGDEWRRKP